MGTGHLAAGVVAMRPFLPARDFGQARDFYEALGFESTPLGEKIALMRLGEGKAGFTFLLQDFYLKEFAENLMMHLLVQDLDGWWRHIEALELDRNFGARAPVPPKLQPWGLRVAYLWDPAGVLWHVAEQA